MGGWESVWKWVVEMGSISVCSRASCAYLRGCVLDIYVFCVCVYVFCVCVYQGAQRFFSIEQQLRLEIDSFGNPL